MYNLQSKLMVWVKVRDTVLFLECYKFSSKYLSLGEGRGIGVNELVQVQGESR